MPTAPVSRDRSGSAPRWRRALLHLLDLVYPPACELCRVPLRGNRWLCDPCAARLPRLEPPFCDRCGEPFDGRIAGPFACPNCRDRRFAFRFARPALRNHPQTRELIHQLKYNRHLHLARELARLAAAACTDPRLAPALAGRWPVVPVPLHPGRLQRRTFNQSAEIARHFARDHGLPVLDALRRVRDTGTQTRLSRRERLANLRDAFAPTPAGHRFAAARPAGVIVFDDVLTTGATTHACARALRAAGVQMVVVVTVLRG